VIILYFKVKNMQCIKNSCLVLTITLKGIDSMRGHTKATTAHSSKHTKYRGRHKIEVGVISFGGRNFSIPHWKKKKNLRASKITTHRHGYSLSLSTIEFSKFLTTFSNTNPS
jgi:hypothetical protein